MWSWLKRAGEQAKRVYKGEIEQGHLELRQIQADELKVNTYRGVLWIGMVMMVTTRLWLGGSVNRNRGKRLLEQMFQRARRAGHAGELLAPVDGFIIYLEVIPRVFQRQWNWLQVHWSGWR